jgi:hypothetical protein
VKEMMMLITQAQQFAQTSMARAALHKNTAWSIGSVTNRRIFYRRAITIKWLLEPN